MSKTGGATSPSRPASAARPRITEEQAEQQLAQLISEVRMLEAYYGEIVARIQTASAGLSDIRGAIQALDALSKNQKGEFLLPIGGGVLLPLGNVEASKLIVSVGAGVAVEKNLDSARTYLQAREKELQNALSALEQQRREIGSRLETGRSILQQLSGQG